MLVTWRRFLAAGGAAAVAAAMLPHDLAPLFVDAATGLAAAAALVVGMRRYRPSRPLAWWLLGVAVGGFAVGDVLYFGRSAGWGAAPSSLTTPLYAVAYGAMLVGLGLLAHSRGPVRRVEGLLDAGVVVANLLAVWWAAVIAPGVAATDGSAPDVALAVLFPLAGALLVGSAVRLGAVCGRTVSARLLLASVVLIAVADASLQVSQAVNGATPRLLLLVWAVGYVLFGAAALHPSMRELSEVDLVLDDVPSRRRMALILAATLALPAAGLVQVARGDAPWAAIVLAPVVVVLVGSRVILLVGRLARQAAELIELVDTDHVTGLPNGRRLRSDLDALLATSGRAGVLFVGIEHLAEVAELVEPSVGEGVLHATGRRLRAAAGPTAVVARVGEAVFAVLDQGACAPAPALVLAERLRSAAERPHALDDGPLALDVAVGAVLVPRDAATAATAMRLADVALAEARERPDHLALFAAEMVDRLPSSAALREVRQALERGEIVLHYQPQVSLGSGRVVGVEALARWSHPTRGLIGPAEFLPLVERGDLVDRFTAHVLALALDQCAAWREAGLRLSVAVNLSARNLLDPRLPAAVAGGLAARGLPASVLELELTETSAMADPERSRHVLDELAELGVSLAVDDYGTGYSSLAYLRQLSVGRLKIDRSFVAGLATDAASRSIVVSTLDLARDLGLDVVAEGVEDDETLLSLRDLGCPHVQGFVVGRPVPAEEVGDLIDRIEGRMPGVLTEPGPGARALELLPPLS